MGQYARRALWLDFCMSYAKFWFCTDNAEIFVRDVRYIYALVTPKWTARACSPAPGRSAGGIDSEISVAA